MDLRQDTPIGQVNAQQFAENRNSVGSAFAAVNPPMQPLRAGIIPPEGSTLNVDQWQQVIRQKPQSSDIPPAGDLPQAWSISDPTPRNSYTTADVINGLLATPEQWAAKDQPVCGVVTVQNGGGWSPKSVRSIPPSLTNKLGMYLSAQWVMLFNGSAFARRKNRWAMVTTRGPVVILSGITLQDRPINPSDFPPCVTAGLTTYEADQLAIGANQPRCQFAHVPKEWTIPVRRADTVEMDGDA